MQNNIFQIYLAGGMQNLSFEEQNEWREKFNEKMINRCLDVGIESILQIINPVEYYNFTLKKHKTEKEVVRFDTNLVRNSNLIIVNANDPYSIGTSMEIAISHEHRIPILILNDRGIQLHPWWIEMSDRIFDSMDELTRYVEDFYISLLY